MMYPPDKNSHQQTVSLVGNVRYALSSSLQIAAGPAVTWIHSYKGENPYEPVFSIVNYTPDHANRLLPGARVALSVHF
jgi:hypothetical protein